MSTPRKRWFRVADSIGREPWDNDVLATCVRLMAHLNTRWARDGLDVDSAARVTLRPGDLMEITGRRRLDVARMLLRRLADLTSMSVTCPGDMTEISWPKFAEFQDWLSRLGEKSGKRGALSASASASAPAYKKEEEKSAPPAAVAAPLPNATEPPSDQSPIRPSKQRPPPTPEAVQFAEDFRSAVQATNPGRDAPSSAAFAGWCDSVRVLLSKRPEAEARALAKWLFNGSSENAVFWRGVVFCPSKFRQKYDQLKKARERDEGNPRRTAGGSERGGTILDAAQRVLRSYEAAS